MMKVKIAALFSAGILAMAMAGTLASAQASDIANALNAGTIGEQVDGYLGIRGTISDDLRAQVNDMNIKRRDLYTAKAQEKGATIVEAAKAFGCEKVELKLAPGRWYAGPDKVWKQKTAGQTILFDGYCPR